LKEKVAIVGMATTSRHLAPFDDPEFDIWSLNESYYGGHKGPDGKTPYLKRFDAMFQLHPRWDYTRAHNFNHPGHPQWLRNDPWTKEELAEFKERPDHPELLSYGASLEQRRNTDFPIYMLELDDEIPGSTLYPLQEVMGSFHPNHERVRYFTNSFGYMLALALYNKYKEIHAYGFEMSSETEYGSQKPNAEFWLGICIGRGVKLVLPQGCRLLGEHEQLYGYEKVPGITLMHLEIERNQFRQQLNEIKVELEQIRGKQNMVREELLEAQKTKQRGRIKRGQEQMSKLVNAEVNSVIKLNSINTAMQMAERRIRDLKGLPSPEQIQLISLGRQIEVG